MRCALWLLPPCGMPWGATADAAIATVCCRKLALLLLLLRLLRVSVLLPLLLLPLPPLLPLLFVAALCTAPAASAAAAAPAALQNAPQTPARCTLLSRAVPPLCRPCCTDGGRSRCWADVPPHLYFCCAHTLRPPSIPL